MKKLEGKTALVTGGNSGIGLATAKAFKDQGARVIITARSPETFQKAKAEYGKHFDVVQTDVSNMNDLDRLYSHIKTTYGGLDVIFANAGIARFEPTTEITPEKFDDQFNTNVRGLYFTIAKALPILRKGSAVVLNASVIATKGSPGGSVYAATKAAVRSLARSWTAEIPVDHVRFNVISPGPIETPIFDRSMSEEQKAGFIAGVTERVPAKRMGQPEEIASAVVFLASKDASFFAGADLVADGGYGQI
jgi:NAD(P)-dependent dehydrogenase (short-subunit alcohol dehydrogenase family)